MSVPPVIPHTAEQMENLARQRCSPCHRGTPSLSTSRARELLSELSGWQFDSDGHLSKRWAFDDFAQALSMVNVVGSLAEEEGHHPDIRLGWGYVEIEIWTHAIGGLSINDFILAAKIDHVVTNPQPSA